MSEDVKVMVCPGGERLVLDEDDARVRAEALRLGVIEQLSAAIRNGTGHRGASTITKDGERFVAIIVWAGFEKPSKNGWASISATPANEKTAGWLMDACRVLINADSVAMFPASASWRN
jgi:hypothetical protein